MPYFTTSDGTEIYYTDQGSGRPVLFSHGWPLSSDAWKLELKLVADAGFRAIAHDRRGHGRSTKTYTGNDIDTYARDLGELAGSLDLHDIVTVGHSTGGGEAVRFAARYANGRVRKVFTAGAIPPVMVQSDSNPDGLPIAVFDDIRAHVLADSSEYWFELAQPFFGFNRPGVAESRGLVLNFWRQSEMAGLAAAYDCVAAFSETDLTEDLQALDVPIFIAHGTDDQIVPIADAARKSIHLVKHGRLKEYEGASHGIWGWYQKQLVDDLLKFIAE
ncbi:alpha/beta hydrolase [Herbiconiux sp. VKM Ac-1786]|uniref:alpha/beta fold hydrolase n=1 Tax=Herbiconiux sp. VKM Ac-1786 TaxID=2783824 RepID=UPI00188A594F|nr:alpha/beta hydrolase [Herbiconiux sp. VKM Ac-1786]MBF4571815.1 alpha/beta hydrolase [Herbiconiux sp. VKM Ac-1786]